MKTAPARGIVKANGIDIWHETYGSRTDPAVLLIMGLGAQAISWPDGFCELLAAGGRFVIRYDNRDIGLSQYFDGMTEQYTLDDMAADAVGVLDALDIPAAHVVGASMGGMIAQLIALDHPSQVLTLTSIMSTPGGPGLEPPTPEALAVLGQTPPPTRDERVAALLANRRVLAAGGFPEDDGFRATLAAASVDRAFHPEGAVRQAYAIGLAPPRSERLASLSIPTLVIHGTADPLVPYSHGLATAQAIPDATLLPIAGMGHEVPPGAWDVVVPAILNHTAAHPE